MSDLISRQAAIDAIEEYADRLQMVNWKENPNVPYKVYSLNWCINTIRDLPSAQPEPLTLRVNHELTKEEYDKLMHDIKDAPIVLLPPAQSGRKKGQWLLQRAPNGKWECWNGAKYNCTCSKCGEEAYEFFQPFCHHCGADMRGEEDEE